MFNTMFDKGSLPAMEAWLHWTVHKHKVISNNIANVETPFYKTMDVPDGEFSRIMGRAWEEQRRSEVGTWEMSRRDGIVPKRANTMDVRYLEASPENAGILRHIENNVDIDLEMGKMVKNTGLHNMLAQLLTQQFDLMREAIRERVA